LNIAKSSFYLEISQKCKGQDIKSIIKKDDYGENNPAEYIQGNSTNQFIEFELNLFGFMSQNRFRVLQRS